MKNSRFTPRTNSFTKKVMAITTKVMIFGVLLSLFLYACIGADSLNEGVAYAAQLSGYGDSWGDLTLHGTVKSNGVGRYFDTFAAETTLIAGSSTGNSNVTNGWTGSDKDYSGGWNIVLIDSPYYALKNGCLTVMNPMEIKEHATENTLKATLYKKSGGTVVKSTISSSAKTYGDLLSVSDEAFKLTSTSDYTSGTGLYYYYVKLEFDSEWWKSIKAEAVLNGIRVKMSSVDTVNPADNGSSGTTIKVKDYNSDGVGAGLRYVQIERGTKDANGNWVTANDTAKYYAPSSRDANTPIGTHTNNSSLVSSFSFTNTTKDFQCTVKKAGYYKVTGYSHVNQTGVFYFEVKPGNLILNDADTGATYTINGAVSAIGADLTVPAYLLATGTANTFTVGSSANGVNINDAVTREGYGIAGYTATTNATIVKNGVTATYQATTLADVTLTVNWEELFMLKYHNPLSTASSVTRYANTNTATSMDIIGSADQASLIQKTPTGAWSGFVNPVGYYLAGWEDRNNDITYDAYGDTVYNFAQYSNSDSVELYAIWQPIEFAVVYNVNGGVGSIPTQTGLTINNIGQAQDTNSTFDQIANNFFTYWSVSDVTFRKGGYFTTTQVETLLSAGQDNIADGDSQTITLTANWTGALEFGKRANGTGAWGSETNPYVISSQAHLNNLAALVNASSTSNGSVNSGKLGSYVGSPYATYTGTNAEIAVYEKTDGNGTKHYYSYAGAYFVLEINNLSRSATIGGGAKKFAGHFDGNGNTISFTYSSGDSYIGVFAYVYAGGSVHDLNVTANISKTTYQTGSIAGRNEGSIYNCTVSGTVASASNYAGGIVGYNFGTIENCHSTAKVSGVNMVGGIVGYNNRDNDSQAFVINCTNTGEVSGTTQIGGIVGYNYGDISGCSNSGSVTASSDFVGGIAGYNITKSGLANGLVTNCYNTGTIKGSAGGVGGIVGDNLAVVQYSVNKSTSITGKTNVGGVVGRNTDNGSVQYVYNLGTATAVVGGTSNAVNSVLGWTVVTSAKTGKADTGYYLVNLVGATVKPMNADGRVDDWSSITTTNITGFYVENVTIANDKYFALFSGATEIDPSDVSMSTDGDGRPVVAYAELNVIPTGDLTITLADLEFGRDWTLSGNWGSASNPYYIRNATHLKNLADILAGTKSVIMSDSTSAYYGKIFEVTANITGVTTAIGTRANGFRGTFDGKDYTITVNISTTEADCLGLFACLGNYAVVKNLTVTGTVSGLSNVGGIAGFNNGATIQNCHVKNITITSTQQNVAGIVAFNNGATVSGCTVASATITGGANNAGGIVGNNFAATAIVQNCDSSATVNGSGNHSGGIVGYNEGKVSGCTNSGSVTGGENYAGGIVGYSKGDIENCTNTANINSGSTNYVGGIVGRTISTISGCTNSGSVTGGNYIGGIAGHTNNAITDCDYSGYIQLINSDYVGGIVGYNAGTLTNCHVTSSNYVIIGRSYVGGIAGCSNGAITNCSDKSQYGVAGTGSYVGGIVGYNTSTVSGCAIETREVDGRDQSAVGGIVGHNTGTVTGCYSKLTVGISGKEKVGGIAGFSNGIVTNCVNESAVSASDYNAGGIVGRLDNGGLIQYSVNFGAISCANSGAGGIVGYMANGTADCVYNFGSCSGASFGGVSSGARAMTGAWAFATARPDGAQTSTQSTGYYFIAEQSILDKVKPMVGTTINGDWTWTDILTNNFDGFALVGLSTVNGQYLSLQMGNNFATPSNTITSTANADGSVVFGDIHYGSVNGVPYSASADITVQILDVILQDIYGSFELQTDYNPSTADVIDMIYDGRDKLTLLEAVISGGNVAGYTGVITANADSIITSNGTKIVNAQAVNSGANGVVFGQFVQQVQIKAFDFNADYAQYYYNGLVYGDVDKYNYDGVVLSNITNGAVIAHSDKDSTENKKFYVMRKLDNGEMVCVITFDYETLSSNIVREFVYGTDPMEFTFTHYAPVSVEQTGVITGVSDGSTKFTGKYNFAGTRTINYVIVSSDFGRLGQSEKAWGSEEENPYVISHWAHLVRLSEIVNGKSAPLDSVQGAQYADNVVAKDVFFSAYRNNSGKVFQSYFVVVDNVTIPEGVAFAPIGGAVVEKYNANNDRVTLSYFGGNFNGRYDGQTATINLGNALKEAHSRDYVGLFGVVKGTTINGTTINGTNYWATIDNVLVSATEINGNNYVGSLIAKAEELVYIDNSATPYQNTAKVTGYSHVGGVVGYVGRGTQMFGTFINKGTVMATSEYAGGIIGRLVAGAGRQGTGTGANNYYFGEPNNGKTLTLENQGTIDATSCAYVGGIIGALTPNTGDYSGVTTVLTVNYVRNTASVWGETYVGGWFGEVGSNVAVHVINGTGKKDNNQWSYNGSMSSNVYDSEEKLSYTISGTDYVGGLVGKLSVMGHQLTGVFNTMSVIGYGSNVGGLVGMMDGGNLTNCFVSLPDKEIVTTETSLVNGAENVGGLIGMMNAGALKDCYVQGFDYDVVTANRGGVAGVAQAVATISNTWALYVTGTSETVKYNTTARNSYGKYILTYSGNAMSTIDEMLVFAGLMQDGDIANGYRKATTKIAGEKGKIALGITLPETTNKNVQLTFYDASGYESPFLYPFDGAVNDSTTSASMLYIRLGSGAGSSIIIAATPVRFGSVADYGKTTAWEDAYINIGTAGLYKADVISADNSSNISVSYQTLYSYDYSATDNYVIISRIVSKTLSQGDEETPFIIASTTDWNNFANNLTNYAGKYVKLANNITVTTLAGTTDGNKYFTGTFDGDGYTITFNVNANHSAGYSLFPGARNATFKNLTVAGSITNAGGNSAGFVGRAYGSLTFENCTNKVNISKTSDASGSGYSIGGFIGTTAMTKDYANGKSYTFIGCVNQGNISVYDRVGQITYAQRSQRDPETHGVGGFIGTAWNGDLTITYNKPMNDDSIGGGTGDGEPQYGFSNVCGTTPKVTMESCRNAGNVLGSYNVGGLVGYNSCATEVMNCGNTGKIEAIGEGTSASESTKMNRDSRTYILTEVEKDWLGTEYNKKRVYIRRYLNAGGLVGLSTSKGHVDMYTSYNSGEIHAWGSNAGGLIASDTEYTKVRPSQATKIFYCYNTGSVITGGDKYTVFHGYNSAYTDRYDANNNTEKDDYLDDQRYLISKNGTVNIDDTDKTKQSVDHYQMSIRHEDNMKDGETREGGAFGVQVGGIIGATTNTDINYCYNLGTITCRGLATYTFKGKIVTGISTTYTEYHARAGGIVGYVDGGEVSVQNSYSVGDVKLEARHAITGTWGIENWVTQLKDFKQQRPMYVAGIVGHHNTVADLSSKVKNCFSIKWQCHYLNDDNKWERYHLEGYNPVGELVQDWQTNHLKFVLGNELPVRDEHSSSGHVVSSVAQLTGITNASGEVTLPAGETYDAADPEKLNQGVMKSYTVPSATTMNHSNANGLSDVRALLNGYDAIKNASVSGWIYMPGCLPQLSMFAVDTQDGLAMTSLGYGRNNMGEFVQQPAGSEFNPYIIKDGVDLLGLSSLVSANAYNRNFSFEGKYIEFANGTNNLRGDTTSYIQMPTLSYQRLDGENCSDYVFIDNGTVKEGKSYQLYNRAANGLHGVKSNSTDTSQVSSRPATSIRATAQSSAAYSPLNTDKLDSAYITWAKKHYAFNGTSMTTQVLFDVHNFNPIGYQGENGSDRSFKGNISGHIKTNDNGTVVQTEIRGLKVNQAAGETANTYAGLFGLVKNATIEYITVTGNVTGYNTSGGTAQAGIVAKAMDSTTIRGLRAGTGSAQFVVKTSKGDAGFVGGILGMGDSGATGNRLTLESCDVRNADISSHKYGVGGIIGYTQGDTAASFTDVNLCTVTIANIYSTNGHSVGGIIGTQGVNGAVAVYTSQVGRSDGQGSVTISGERALGGIIAYADASSTCANSFMDCRVYSNVTIKRTGDSNAGDYGTAIGGIVGAILDNTGGYATFSGRIQFHGTIDLGTYTNNKNVGGVVGYMGTTARMEESIVMIGGNINIDDGGAGENIGGFAGISKGVCLDGRFFIYPTLNTPNSDNVGGFIGYNDGDTYITRTAEIYTGKAVNGLISGVEDANGVIIAGENVGGFIGSNADGKILHVGTEEYAGTNYGTDTNRAVIKLSSSVDGVANVGGFLGYNGGYFLGEYTNIENSGSVGAADDSKGTATADGKTQHFGGVIGNATRGSTIYLSEYASVVNKGQVGHESFKSSYQQFVGGIIGASYGEISIQGTLANNGNVYGYEYVGGAIGVVGAGAISGNLDNGVAPETNAVSSSYAGGEAFATSDIQGYDLSDTASVTAVRNVGGVIGIVMQDATIKNATMHNYGIVIADSVGVDGTNYVSNLGGVIGLHYGVISESQFYNHGNVTAENFAGGAIGVSDGIITGGTFINYAVITYRGNTALGGAVGYITNGYVEYYPNANLYEADMPFESDVFISGYGNVSTLISVVAGSSFSYKPEESTDGQGYADSAKVVVQATGERAYTEKDLNGGLGGVFGVIDSQDITSANWKGNNFFIHGDVFGGVFKNNGSEDETKAGLYVSGLTSISRDNFTTKVANVGGVVGIVAGAYVTINDMLVYNSIVAGSGNVGGIIGSNGSTNTNDGTTLSNGTRVKASIDNCFNVYGDIWGNGGGLVGTISGNAVTYGSYWVRSFANEDLQNVDPENIAGTLDQATYWVEYLSYKNYVNNADTQLRDAEGNLVWKTDEDGNTVLDPNGDKIPVYEHLTEDAETGELITWDEYFESINHTVTVKDGNSTNSYQLLQNSQGDWGYYSVNDAISYNTGTQATGFYYLFANDGNKYAQDNITVDHNGTLRAPYADASLVSLNYWLVIADSHDKAVVDQPIDENDPSKGTVTADDFKSALVYNNGTVQTGHIYSTAYTASSNGFYLYVNDSKNRTQVKSVGTKLYMDTDTSSSGNIMIFYKEYSAGKDFEYNGFDRYAPANHLEYSASIPTEKNADNFGKYFYTLDASSSIGRNAGSYDTVATVWTVLTDGTPIVVGSVDSRDAELTEEQVAQYQWKINPRKITVEYDNQYNVKEDGETDEASWLYDGTYSHYMTVEVSNIALDASKAFSSGSSSTAYTELMSFIAIQVKYQGSTKEIEVEYNTTVLGTVNYIPVETDNGSFVIAYCIAESDGKVSGDNTLDSNGKLSISTYFKVTYRIYAKNAGDYDIDVNTTTAGSVNHKIGKLKDKQPLVIGRKEITLDFDLESTNETFNNASNPNTRGNFVDGYYFDGGQQYRGIQSITFTGVASADVSKLASIIGIEMSRESESADENGQNSPEEFYTLSNSVLTITTSDIGTYTISLNLESDYWNNYYLVQGKVNVSAYSSKIKDGFAGDTAWGTSWTINKRVIQAGHDIKIDDKTVYYNGQEHSLAITGLAGGGKWQIGNETVTVNLNLQDGQGSATGKKYVNANPEGYVVQVVSLDGKKLGGTVERTGSIKSYFSKEDLIKNYDIQGDVTEESTATLTILPREVRIVWKGNPTTSFVYNGNAQGLSASAVALQINMKETPGDSDDWVEVGALTISGNVLTVSGILEHTSTTGKVSETLTFDVSNFTATNAGTYTATIGSTIKSATGKNDGGDTLKTNYDYDNSQVEDGKTYTIAKSQIVLTFNSDSVAGKVFDNSTTVNESLPAFTLSSSNGGSVPATSAINVDSKDYAKSGTLVKNVGTGYDVIVKYSLNSSFNTNFELVGSGVATLKANASITPKGITVILNTASGTNTVYKTFDNDTLYAEVSSNGSKTVSSSGMKPGRGITVEGFLTSGVTVSATFQESDRTRSQFDEYVNNVKVDRNVYSMTSGFYKQLYIELLGTEGNNYYIAKVTNKAGETVVSGSGKTITVMDSRQDGTTSKVNMAIAITPYSIKVSYSGTTQSYANADNTYNTTWNPVVCSDNKIPDSWHFTDENLKVEVSNGWMTANGGVYKKYTRIAGKAGNSTLGAKLTSDKGYNFCVTLRNQPTLIIGYFVERPEGNAIGTMAGLLIATEYYKGNFAPEGAMSYDYVQTVIDVKTVNGKYNSWEELLQEEDFDFTTTDVYKNLLAEYNATSDEDKKEVLLAQLESFEFTLVDDGKGNSTLQLVYWKAEEIADTQKFTSFYLINNIDAVMTETDMEMIKEAFGANWGAGKTYLSNVIFAQVGSAVIFNGSVFDYTIVTDENGKTTKQAFNGQFDGYGYTIDHLTITHTVKGDDEEVNVGMFAEVSGLGSKVTAINFRNLGIYVTDNTGIEGRVINVGALAGKYAGTQAMRDITVHGTISVKSSSAEVYVGGVLGRDGTGYEDGDKISSVLEGAIVVATIRAEGKVAVAGGIVGIMTEYRTSMTNLVSLSEVYAKGETTYANGFVGRYKGMVGESLQMTDGINYAPITTDGKESAFMDSVFTISVDGVYTKVNGGGKTYTELYDGSNTAFNASGKYTTPVTSNAYGKYDVVSEKNAFAEANTTGTMRLKDIVDIYVLGYGLSKTTATVEGATVNTYQKSNTSKYFHASGAPAESPAYKPDGTTDNPIKIAYQQHLSLLRMFNFMNFTVTNDITMYTGYNLALVDEAFTGKVNAGGKSINVRSAQSVEGTNAVMFAYQPESFTWLVVD